MNGLQSDTRVLLDAYVVARMPAADAVERAWAEVQTRIADGPPAMAMDDARAVERMVPLRRVVVGLAVATAVVLAWRVVPRTPEVQGDSLQAETPFVAPSVSRVETVETAVERRPTEDRSGDGPLADTEPTVLLPSEPGASVTVPRPRKPSVRPRASTKPRETLGLKQETAILRAGEAALAEGDAHGALAAFDRHAREFPGGQLVPERMFKRAVALCELGRVKAARNAVNAFLRAYPGSPLRARVEDVCTGD